jgi:NAD(P)-dependent dehydrogenase (short-subunit alcohol dehydrogenase family)
MPTDNRVAVVTGGSSGIGRGIAIRLAEDGLDVVVADVRREPKQGRVYQTDVTEPTDEVIESQTDASARFVETDVSDEAAVEAMVAETVETFGSLDVLVNNAFVYRPGGLRDLSLADWQTMLDVNLTGYFLTAKHAFDHLAATPHGRVVNVSSINAEFGGSGPSYASIKAAIVNFTRDLAVEGADDGVTANVVLPGVIKTASQDINDEETRQRERERTLLDRVGEPEDVAAAVSFFASEEAEWITGADLTVDGGFVAGW